MQQCRLGRKKADGLQDVQDSEQAETQKKSDEGIIGRGLSAVKQIMQDVTSTIYESFVNLKDNKKIPQNPYTNRKPSKMTIQLIRQIHRGFEPLELSFNRWVFEEEEENKRQKKHVEEMVFNQELLNSCESVVKPKRKRIVRIVQEKLEDPKAFEWNLWKIAEDNIGDSKKRLQAMQKAEKEKQQKQKQKQKARQQNQKQINPAEDKLSQMKEISQDKPGSAVMITDQNKKTINQAQQKLTKTVQQNLKTDFMPLNEHKSITPAQPDSAIGQRVENKQLESNTDKLVNVTNKVENPFLSAVSKPLSLADLQGLKTDIFSNKNTQSVQTNHFIPNNTLNINQLPTKNVTSLWSNRGNGNQEQSSKIELRPELFSNIQKTAITNNQNTSPLQFTGFTQQQGNPFSQVKPISIVKKGLAPGQVTSAAIFKPNQNYQKNIQNQCLSKQVRQFSQTFSSGSFSNDKVKQMFSSRQAPPAQPQSLFGGSSQPRQNTEKKAPKSNRRGKRERQTRIN